MVRRKVCECYVGHAAIDGEGRRDREGKQIKSEAGMVRTVNDIRWNLIDFVELENIPNEVRAGFDNERKR